MTVEELEFWLLVNVRGADECWPWLLSTRGAGYGQCSEKYDHGRIACRAAFVYAKGPLPAGKRVCHTCDNPPCCNPSHLFAGTAKDNTQDAIKKGRFKLPPRHKKTGPARAQLARKYADPKWRKEQGDRIAAGFALKKAQRQDTVRQFAFGFQLRSL